ncbi:hypothetical protein ACGFJT_44320 [Actinomadura geliboluensis]|uniref:hypothetical protein n=1 Tax=Actinomadura geliboluensis TaxID=882440 RepID=UPI0037231A62
MSPTRRPGDAIDDGRGVTGPGRHAELPDGWFEAPEEIEESTAGLQVLQVVGDDGRSAEMVLDRLKLAGWVGPMGRSLALRVGLKGGLRTHASARSVGWGPANHFVNYLAELPILPEDPSQLRVRHLEGYLESLKDARNPRSATAGYRSVRLLLKEPPTWELLTPEVRDFLNVRLRKERRVESGVSGYSDGELRRLVTRLREEAIAIRDRVDAGRELIEQFQRAPREIPERERRRAAMLAQIAETGVVPAEVNRWTFGSRRRLATALFLTPMDVTALSALFVVVADRNLETIKELPATCRKLSDKAIEVTLTKRRRGAGNWYETVAWEIGPPGEELHYPGGLFLMVQRLTSLSRRTTGAQRLWSVWVSGHRSGRSGLDEQVELFAKRLDEGATPGEWSARHKDLFADPVPGQEERVPLALDTQRLKTSVEVRRTKRMGGHLPSSARSNTYPVLFSDYLRGDETAREWAEDVVTDALADAEESAWTAHQDALKRQGGQLRVVPEPTAEALEAEGIDADTAQRIVDGQQDTAYAACVDPDERPDTGKPCRTPSLLDCFNCGNCLVTRVHLPQLLALLDALNSLRGHFGEAEWWRRYGSTWVAIRRDIIDGRHFTPEDIARAQDEKPDDALLDLVENPWETNP